MSATAERRKVRLTCPQCKIKRARIGGGVYQVVTCLPCGMTMTLDAWLEWKAEVLAGKRAA